MKERECETIVGVSLDHVETVDIFDGRGRLQENVETNSERHWEAGKKSPASLAYPPIGKIKNEKRH